MHNVCVKHLSSILLLNIDIVLFLINSYGFYIPFVNLYVPISSNIPIFPLFYYWIYINIYTSFFFFPHV